MTQWHMFSDNEIYQLQSNQTCFNHLNAEPDSNHCVSHQSAQYNMVVRSVVSEQSLLWLGSQSTDCKLEIWYWNMDITFSFSLLPSHPHSTPTCIWLSWHASFFVLFYLLAGWKIWSCVHPQSGLHMLPILPQWKIFVDNLCSPM